MACVLDDWLHAQCAAKNPADPLRAVHEEQGARLRATLQYARERGRFYGRRLKNIALDDFSAADLPALPFTTATDIRDWQSFLCVSQDAVERMVTLHTSGTSGPPKRLAFSRADLEAAKDFFRVGMSQLVRPGERALALWPGAQRPHGVGDLLAKALGEQGITVFAAAPQMKLAHLGRKLEKHDPHVMIAAPAQLEVLARLLAATPPACRKNMALRGILSSSETLPPQLARDLTRRFGLLALDHYGMTETGYGGGVQCPARDGYHLRELDVIFEIVDMRSGAPLPPGREGEIAITTIARQAMPLIRYRTGDVAAMLPGPCRCGSPMRRLGLIRGRLAPGKDAGAIVHMPKGEFVKQLPSPLTL